MENLTRSRNPRGGGARLRTEIVAAAIALIDETGDPGALTLRGIARRAGVTAPSIYPHFADLAAVTEAVLTQSFEELRAAVAAALDSGQPGGSGVAGGGVAGGGVAGSGVAGSQAGGREPEERAAARRALLAAGHAYVRFAWDHPARYRLMFAASGYAPDAVATFALVREAIRRCAAAGASASDDPQADTWMLWAALHGVATLEKPARPGYLRLGPLDRPALLEVLIRRVARLA